MTPRPSKILLVNSNDDILAKLDSQLTALGHETDKATSVRRGITALQSDYRIDLVICDVFAPKGTGFVFLNSIKSNPKQMFLPFILTSTDCEIKMVQRAIDLGACDVLTVPIQPDDLNRRITRVMKNGKPTVLIVDHNELILGHLEFVAELEGFKAITATTSQSAMEILKDNDISIVLLDADMENPSSLEFMGDIKAHNYNIPVILLTRHSRKYSTEKLLAIGADGILTKPFKNTEMANTIRHLLLRRKVTSIA